MTTDIDILITDMTGHSFIIKLNWDICIMKQSISTHYETNIFNEYLTINNISRDDYHKNRDHLFNWMKSEFYERVDDYYYDNIELIYNGEILEQYHIEIDKITLGDLEENNNMSFVIIKKDRPNNADIDSDNNSIYSHMSD